MKKNRFEVGDTVTLSAAGARLTENQRYKGGFGVVSAVIDDGKAISLLCNWQNLTKGIKGNALFKPYELKFYKPSKKTNKASDTGKPKMYYKHNPSLWS
jgi:uncharacterized protein YodC (DUF2158 family)